MDANFYRIPVIDTIKLAWSKVDGAKGSFWAALGIMFLVIFAFGFLEGLFEESAPILTGILKVVGGLVNFLLQIGVLYMGIQRAKDLPINYKQMFIAFELDMGLRAIGTYILQAIIFIVPMLLIFIPTILLATGATVAGGEPVAASTGAKIVIALCYIVAILLMVYLSIRLYISMGFVLDQRANPIDAIKSSFAATKGNVWNLIGIAILQFLILIVSIIPIGIGLIWTLPFVFILYGVLYKNLLVNVKR